MALKEYTVQSHWLHFATLIRLVQGRGSGKGTSLLLIWPRVAPIYATQCTWVDLGFGCCDRFVFRNSGYSLSKKKHNTLGDRAFSSDDFNLWNNLPLHIRLEDNLEHFTSLLKMHLFRLAFDMQCFQPTSIIYFLALTHSPLNRP